MRKIIVVAVREYQAAVRTKAFIVMLVAMPVLMGSGFIAMKLLEGQVDTTDKVVAVLDRSGILFDRLKQAAEDRNDPQSKKGVFDQETGEQVRPRYLIQRVALDVDDPTQEQLAEQCEKVTSGDWFALVVIGANVQRVDEAQAAEQKDVGFTTADTVDIYSDATAFDEFNGWLRHQINELIRERRFIAAELPSQEIDKCLAHVPVLPCKPLRIDPETGEVVGGTRKSEGADIVVPMITMFLMFMVITIGAAPLINSVLEEKMQRIAEVLLGSVSPFQLMAGKLIGMVGVSMTILTIYLGGAVLGAQRAGVGEYIPPNLGMLIVWFIIFQALAVLMFGAVFIAIGAACSDMKEAQSMLMPVWIVIVFPMMVWFMVVREPTSTFSTVASLIPPATPVLMMLRVAGAPNIPLWQPVLGVVLVLLTTALCVFVAGRIFRVGILVQGKGAKIGDMIRWAVRG